MAPCPSCGDENRAGDRFRDSRSTPLELGEARKTRKLVTVLFCDVTGSTALGEELDSESLRNMMERTAAGTGVSDNSEVKSLYGTTGQMEVGTIPLTDTVTLSGPTPTVTQGRCSANGTGTHQISDSHLEVLRVGSVTSSGQ